jgi:hypothetical protein
LTIDTAVKLGVALGRGQNVVKASRAAGVGKSSTYRWLVAGKAGDPRYLALVEARKPVRTEWDDFLASLLGKGRR